MPLTLRMTNKWESWKIKMRFVECTLSYEWVMNLLKFNELLYNRYIGTDFNKSSGNSKEDKEKKREKEEKRRVRVLIL